MCPSDFGASDAFHAVLTRSASADTFQCSETCETRRTRNPSCLFRFKHFDAFQCLALRSVVIPLRRSHVSRFSLFIREKRETRRVGPAAVTTDVWIEGGVGRIVAHSGARWGAWSCAPTTRSGRGRVNHERRTRRVSRSRPCARPLNATRTRATWSTSAPPSPVRGPSPRSGSPDHATCRTLSHDCRPSSPDGGSQPPQGMRQTLCT